MSEQTVCQTLTLNIISTHKTSFCKGVNKNVLQENTFSVFLHQKFMFNLMLLVVYLKYTMYTNNILPEYKFFQSCIFSVYALCKDSILWFSSEEGGFLYRQCTRF